MESEAPIDIASTLQGASINRHPSPRHDINPSTAASERQPVTIDAHHDLDGYSELDEDEIPISVLDPVPRKQNMPPLPDLRFEQSYLKSIEQAEGWQGVAWITLRDQVRIKYGAIMANADKFRSSCALRKAYYGRSFSAAGDIGIDQLNSVAKVSVQRLGDGGGA